MSSGDAPLALREASSPEDLEEIDALMDEYVAWDRAATARLGLDPEAMWSFFYQGDPPLPSAFAPPAGCLLLASRSGEAAGCGGYRRLEDGSCELKRMFVRPAFRGQGIGRALAAALLARAEGAGYRVVRLETTTFMQGAPELFRSLGFRPCEPYYAVPEMFRPVTLFMERHLS
jgi:GNAT superfamily N-acetyltransferase